MYLETDRCSIKAGRLFAGTSRYCLFSQIVKINNLRLLAQATRSDNNELVIVVSNDTVASDLLVLYAMRWNIECLFGQVKTRGLNFEDTHITIPYRVGNLMKLIVLSFAVCYLVGLASNVKTPIPIKKHGRQLLSYFRRGLDIMTQFLNTNYRKAVKIISLCFNEIMVDQKFKKLICVLY